MTAHESLALVTAIKQLPHIQSELVILHYLYDHPLDEVARTLDLAPEEIQTHHYAALTSLRG